MQHNLFKLQEIDIRRINRNKSPKKGGSSDIDSIPYLEELGLKIYTKQQPIKFSENINEHIHRWAPYVQGFSASFVQSQFERYRKIYQKPVVLDPFAGCGTVLVQAKINGYISYGIELNPLLHFIADTKLNTWDISPTYLIKVYKSLSKEKRFPAPNFLKSYKQFNKEVLKNLEILRGAIEALPENTVKQKKVKHLLKMAFSAILIDCSNLKRSPCLGYTKKKIYDTAPFVLFDQKIKQLAEDLKLIHTYYNDYIHVFSKVFLANSMYFNHEQKYDLVITSPPYMNGLDYVMNYKIEMAWLGFVNEHSELRHIKNEMVVCDNVSKAVIKNFTKNEKRYTNEWIEKIKKNIIENIDRRGKYRRMDMPDIVHKYFDDMYKVMANIYNALNENGRFILVVGDSLIADVYIPTDLLIAKIGRDLGYEIERIEKARERRSGQIRSYRLRESIITLIKN